MSEKIVGTFLTFLNVCLRRKAYSSLQGVWPLSVGKLPLSMGLALSTQNFVLFLLVMSNMFLGLKVGKAGELFYGSATTLFLSC